MGKPKGVRKPGLRPTSKGLRALKPPAVIGGKMGVDTGGSGVSGSARTGHGSASTRRGSTAVLAVFVVAALALSAVGCASESARQQRIGEDAVRAATRTAQALVDDATKVVRDTDREARWGGTETAKANAAATQAATPTATLIPCQGAIACDDFPIGVSPQEYWERCERPAQMDLDGDGKVCEED